MSAARADAEDSRQASRARGATRRLRVLAVIWVAGLSALILSGAADGGIVSDDAFYYFEITRNAARGEGFSFDGRGPTNGFHPLWTVLLLPVFSVLGDAPTPPVRAALILSVLLAGATAFALQRLFARVGSARAGELAGIVWLCNPLVPLLALRGLETSLNAFALSLSFHAVLRVSERCDRRALLWLGALLGICGLARTENALWAVSVAFALVVGSPSAREALRRLVRVAAAALLVASPWLVWNLATFGTLLQTSGVARSRFRLYGWLPSPLEDPGLPVSIGSNALLALSRVRDFVFDDDFAWIPGLLLLDLALLAAGGRLLRKQNRSEASGSARVGAALRLPGALFVALHFGYYLAIACHYAHWYLAPPFLLLCVAHGVRLGGLGDLRGRRYLPVAAAAALAGLCLAVPVVSGHLRAPGPDRNIARLADRLGDRARSIGVWNAGRIGYRFSFLAPQVEVVNLDGLVNNRVTELQGHEAYARYLQGAVEWIAEHPMHLSWMVPPHEAQAFARRHLQCDERIGPRTLCRVRRALPRRRANRSVGEAPSSPPRASRALAASRRKLCTERGPTVVGHAPTRRRRPARAGA